MFTQRRVALRFRSTTFRKRGRVATAKVTFSNKSAPVLCKRNAVLLHFCAVFRPIRSSVNVVLGSRRVTVKSICRHLFCDVQFIEILDLECVLCHVTGVQNENKNALINPPSWIFPRSVVYKMSWGKFNLPL